LAVVLLEQLEGRSNARPTSHPWEPADHKKVDSSSDLRYCTPAVGGRSACGQGSIKHLSTASCALFPRATEAVHRWPHVAYPKSKPEPTIRFRSR
jgi:hypothetical protein